MHNTVNSLEFEAADGDEDKDGDLLDFDNEGNEDEKESPFFHMNNSAIHDPQIDTEHNINSEFREADENLDALSDAKSASK